MIAGIAMNAIISILAIVAVLAFMAFRFPRRAAGEYDRLGYNRQS